MAIEHCVGDQVMAGSGDGFDVGVIDEIKGDQSFVRWTASSTWQATDYLKPFDAAVAEAEFAKIRAVTKPA